VRSAWALSSLLVLTFVAGARAEGPTPDPRAPAELGPVVPHVAWPEPPGALFSDLTYLGDNDDIRGTRVGTGLYPDGDVVAGRWRSLAGRVAAVFVLRHGIFSQQDHPFEQRSYATTLPPSWVTMAVEQTRRGAYWSEARLPWLGDDAAWQRTDVIAAFAPFPIPRRLVELARIRGIDRAGLERTRNARITIRALAEHVRVMRSAVAGGPDAVARAGGARIAATDRTYFAEARAHVVPITVERARGEASGVEPMGFEVAGRTIADTSLHSAKLAVLAARLEAGPMAIAHYDVTLDEHRAHVRALLAELVPQRSTGNVVWVHVYAGPNAPGDALVHVARFLTELRGDERIAFERVRVLVLPALVPANVTPNAFVSVRRARDIGVALGIDARAARIPALLTR
jgi:hypothetical protein